MRQQREDRFEPHHGGVERIHRLYGNGFMFRLRQSGWTTFPSHVYLSLFCTIK